MKSFSIKIWVRVPLIMILLFLFGIGLSQAQDLRVTSGLDYYKTGKYSAAMTEFDAALQNPARLGRDILPETYFFRALCRVRLYNNEVISGAKDSTGLNKFALLDAYKDYKSALLNDDGNWAKKIDTELKNLNPYLLRNGLEALNNSNELKNAGKIYDSEALRSQEYLSAAKDIEDTYLVNDLLGQAEMNLKRIPAALSDFARSEDLYRIKAPAIPDFLIGYVTFRMAEIHFLNQNDVDKALEDIRRGRDLVQKEYSRLQTLKGKENSDDLKAAGNKYIKVYQDLTDLELQILLKSPEKHEQALAAFENEIKNNDSDPDLYIGYASLMEKTDPDRALENYQKALSLDTANATALFNAGVLYYNMARQFYQQASEEKDDAKYQILLDKAIENFSKAKPYFEKFLLNSPDSEEAVEAMKAIAMVLDDKVNYQKYKEKSENLKGQKEK